MPANLGSVASPIAGADETFDMGNYTIDGLGEISDMLDSSTTA